MTVREIKQKIRQLTSVINDKISEYKASGKLDKLFEKQFKRAQAATSYVNKKTGEVRVPYEDTGYLGYGFSGKNKQMLENQLFELETFNEREMTSKQNRYRRTERANRAYETFTDRYGYVDFDEWGDFVTMMNDVHDYLVDFGYEDVGNSIANLYAQTNKEGKGRMREYIQEAGNIVASEMGTITPESYIDALADLLEEEGVLND